MIKELEIPGAEEPHLERTFEGGLNSMAVIMLGVLVRRGLTEDGAVNVVNEALGLAKDHLNGKERVVIRGD